MTSFSTHACASSAASATDKAPASFTRSCRTTYGAPLGRPDDAVAISMDARVSALISVSCEAGYATTIRGTGTARALAATTAATATAVVASCSRGRTRGSCSGCRPTTSAASSLCPPTSIRGRVRRSIYRRGAGDPPLGSATASPS